MLDNTFIEMIKASVDRPLPITVYNYKSMTKRFVCVKKRGVCVCETERGVCVQRGVCVFFCSHSLPVITGQAA